MITVACVYFQFEESFPLWVRSFPPPALYRHASYVGRHENKRLYVCVNPPYGAPHAASLLLCQAPSACWDGAQALI